jgi:hypothetical protein
MHPILYDSNDVKRSVFIGTRIRPELQTQSYDSGRYRIFLSDFCSNVSDKIQSDKRYFSDCIGETFDEFSRRLYSKDSNTQPNSLIVIPGGVGSGKTSFFRYLQNLKRFKSRFYIEDFNVNPSDRIDSISAMSQQVACRLDRGVKEDDRQSYQDLLDRLISNLASNKNVHGPDLAAFITEFKSQGKDFINRYPGFDGKLHLSLVLTALSNTTGKPVWIVFDNVDLLGRKDQDKIIRMGHDISRTSNAQGAFPDKIPHFHIVVACRHETYTSHIAGAFVEFVHMRFPEPKLVEIAKRKIIQAASDTARYFDGLSKRRKNTFAPVTIQDQTYSSWREVSDEFVKAVSSVINNLEGASSLLKGWHFSIVNGNVRRFVFHWSQLIINSDFIDDVIFLPKELGRPVSHHRYEAAIIRGGCACYPGNGKFNAGVDRSNGSLIPNLYDNPFISSLSKRDRIRNYLCLIRILQFVNMQNARVSGKVIVDRLAKFFDADIICKSVNFLVWARLVDEVNIGARNIGDQSELDSMSSDINEYEIIKNSATRLYVEKIIINFEYIKAVSYSSDLLVFVTFREVSRKPTIIEEIEHSRLFLTSLLNIILINLRNYREQGCLTEFYETFYMPGANQRVWQSASSSCLAGAKSILLAERKNNVPRNRTDLIASMIEGLEELGRVGEEAINEIISAEI